MQNTIKRSTAAAAALAIFGGGVLAAGTGAAHADTGKTSCKSVFLNGDSTGLGMVNQAQDGVKSEEGNREVRAELTDPLSPGLAKIGVEQETWDVAAGRSAVETIGDKGGTTVPTPLSRNGVEATEMAAKSQKRPDCMIVMLGTNDAANVEAGSNADAATRIKDVLSASDGMNVLWVKPKVTDAAKSPYTVAAVAKFNEALDAAAKDNDKVKLTTFESPDADFAPDGIHFTNEGRQHRGTAITDDLAKAFPG